MNCESTNNKRRILDQQHPKLFKEHTPSSPDAVGSEATKIDTVEFSNSFHWHNNSGSVFVNKSELSEQRRKQEMWRKKWYTSINETILLSWRQNKGKWLGMHNWQSQWQFYTLPSHLRTKLGECTPPQNYIQIFPHVISHHSQISSFQKQMSQRLKMSNFIIWSPILMTPFPIPRVAVELERLQTSLLLGNES